MFLALSFLCLCKSHVARAFSSASSGQKTSGHILCYVEGWLAAADLPVRPFFPPGRKQIVLKANISQLHIVLGNGIPSSCFAKEGDLCSSDEIGDQITAGKLSFVIFLNISLLLPKPCVCACVCACVCSVSTDCTVLHIATKPLRADLGGCWPAHWRVYMRGGGERGWSWAGS